MPFSIELLGSEYKTDHTLHLMIDRTNVIFMVSGENVALCLHSRKRILNLIKKNSAIKPFLSANSSLIETEDPRHDALVHVSEYDRRYGYHCHVLFKKDVNYALLRFLLVTTQFEEIRDLISKASISNALDVAEKYFYELETKPEPAEIEKAYRLQKGKEFYLATKAVKKNKGTAAKDKPKPNKFFFFDEKFRFSLDRYIASRRTTEALKRAEAMKKNFIK